MRPKYTETMLRMTREIQDLAKDLPPGKGHQIMNRCSKINMTIRKIKNMNTEDNFTSQQIADRYNAKKAVFEAMTQGRKISFLDSKEFEVSEMHTTICPFRKDIDSKSLPWDLKEFEVSEIHTTICQIRKDIDSKSFPWDLKDKWITFGNRNKRCKEYWLERRA